MGEGTMNQNFDQQSDTRKAILMAIKQNGSDTISSLASKLNISNEGIRLQLVQLERDGLVKRQTARNTCKGGRPAITIGLTVKGENLFPKIYDALTIEVMDTLGKQLGKNAVKKVLAAMTDVRVSEWEKQINGLNLDEKLSALKSLYMINDQFMDVDYYPEIKTILIKERNCPFYDVAMQRPILCSVTVSTLTRLLGYQVVREKKFQNGDGCCTFLVKMDQPVEITSFSFED
jgi:predicted ArsR family transcriptional regulator